MPVLDEVTGSARRGGRPDGREVGFGSRTERTIDTVDLGNLNPLRQRIIWGEATIYS